MTPFGFGQPPSTADDLNVGLTNGHCKLATVRSSNHRQHRLAYRRCHFSTEAQAGHPQSTLRTYEHGFVYSLAAVRLGQLRPSSCLAGTEEYAATILYTSSGKGFLYDLLLSGPTNPNRCSLPQPTNEALHACAGNPAFCRIRACSWTRAIHAVKDSFCRSSLTCSTNRPRIDGATVFTADPPPAYLIASRHARGTFRSHAPPHIVHPDGAASA
uniref:Uncharacterized protein n=1 Tax=Mycena chlorophos TaxID=658473 RepID=A0ABQ0L0B4_MYCCL|nr:predicted protein [Mycena chlorophos]